METVLKPVLNEFAFVYLDDVIITSPSFHQHLEHLDKVFTLLKNAKFTLKKSKCHFIRKEIKYLGVKITQEGIAVDDEKFIPILGMPPPQNSKQIAKFVEMCVWFSKHIPHFSEICEPLYQLKRKHAKFIWSPAGQNSFEKLKTALTSSPILAVPNCNKPFELKTDASSIGIEAVLCQNGRPIAYASIILNPVECNYPITERECLAVNWPLQKFKVYFSNIPVKVITDHRALTKLVNGKGLSSRMIRWALTLADININIEHRAGSQTVVADALSRKPQGLDVEGKNNVSCNLLPSIGLISRSQLINEQRKDPVYGKIYDYLEKFLTSMVQFI